MENIGVTTIGFTKSSAAHFFERIKSAGVKKVFDVRLNSTSQLAGFAKGNDLPYFLKSITGADYQSYPLLAPTAPMLDAYKKEKGDWQVYQGRFLNLMKERKVEERFMPEMFEGACLLCSEATPEHCHRRLVCEYLNAHWGSKLSVKHL